MAKNRVAALLAVLSTSQLPSATMASIAACSTSRGACLPTPPAIRAAEVGRGAGHSTARVALYGYQLHTFAQLPCSSHRHLLCLHRAACSCRPRSAAAAASPSRQLCLQLPPCSLRPSSASTPGRSDSVAEHMLCTCMWCGTAAAQPSECVLEQSQSRLSSIHQQRQLHGSLPIMLPAMLSC